MHNYSHAEFSQLLQKKFPEQPKILLQRIVKYLCLAPITRLEILSDEIIVENMFGYMKFSLQRKDMPER